MARILVTDDQPEQLALQRLLLEGLGYEVATAETLAEMTAEMGRGRPDLFVVDLGMPCVSDGLRLIRKIRESGCEAPIVVLSGWPDDIYGTPEEQMVSRVLFKGNARELLQAIGELLAA
jgi:CheY-like chemotaxis protein